MAVLTLNERFVERLYGRLLLLYPPDFRVRFGPEMLQIFDDAYALHLRDGTLSKRFAFWFRILYDFARSLGKEWGEALATTERVASSAVTLAESLVIPAAICGILILAGFTTAILTRRALPRGFASPVAEWQGTVFALEAGAVVMLGLGVVSLLGAYLMARRRRASGVWIKL
ncbi:MAG TPA: hypothetical protein VFQ24_09235 [Terriglobia bacterium]|nr:hypothetical protein [Terriglobia bacterium]